MSGLVGFISFDRSLGLGFRILSFLERGLIVLYVYCLFLEGGKKFCTTVDTLTQREPDSMLAAMFSGRHTLCQDSEKVSTC